MKYGTIINKAINSTIINKNVKLNATVINTQIETPFSDIENIVLGNKYKIKEKMDVISGEADLYLCTDGNADFVAKLYRRKFAIKEEVSNKLKSIDSPYVAKIFATGEFNGYPYEILPFYKNGSLKGKKFSYKQLKTDIVPSINEGLHVLHNVGIIHKDLKPSNIMLCDNGYDVAIIDFGISSIKDNNNTVVITRTGMTPEYSAPETFKSLFLNESDYYSFGVTLYELFCGHTPYEQMTQDEIERFVSVQKLPLKDDMNEELKILITALTYPDITNRKNKSNPNRRWGYEEVMKWCIGIKQPVPGEAAGSVSLSGNMKPYKFLGEIYTDRAKLVDAFNNNWDEGKKQLYRGLLSTHFRTFDAETAGFCIDAEEEIFKGDEDFIFFKTLYKICPELKAVLWKGKKYDNLSILGRELLEALWNDSEPDFCNFIDEILNKSVLSKYISYMNDDKDKIKILSAYESSHRTYKNRSRQKTINYYLIAYALSGNKIFYKDGIEFTNIDDLITYMSNLLDNSYEKFEKFCNELVDYDNILNSQFESWLIALGKKDQLAKWRFEFDKKGLQI